LTALAGANLIYGLGMLELGKTFDYAQMLMDNEMVRMINKAIAGIPVNEESMAVDVIKQVGASGEFITHEHTYKHFKAEQSQSKLIDRTMRHTWLENGSKDYTQRAYEEAVSILNSHKPDPLPAGAAASIRAIIEEAEDEFGIKKK
jgi:trimethylamine---corrinoid protein Co-methyltransferase